MIHKDAVRPRSHAQEILKKKKNPHILVSSSNESVVRLPHDCSLTNRIPLASIFPVLVLPSHCCCVVGFSDIGNVPCVRPMLHAACSRDTTDPATCRLLQWTDFERTSTTVPHHLLRGHLMVMDEDGEAWFFFTHPCSSSVSSKCLPPKKVPQVCAHTNVDSILRLDLQCCSRIMAFGWDADLRVDWT